MKRALLTTIILIVAIAGTVGCGSDAGEQAQPPSSQQGAPMGGQPAGNPPSGNQPSRGGMPDVSGTVKSISGTTIQVTTQNGSTSTVAVNDGTIYQKNASATLADIKTGDVVMVTSDQTGAAVTAKSILIGGPSLQGGQRSGTPAGGGPGGQRSGTPAGGGPGGQPGGTPGAGGPGGAVRPGAAGTVKSTSGNTIVVTAQDNSTVTVTVDAKTTYNKMSTGALGDVQVGTRITASGESSNGTLTARLVQIGGTGQ